LTVLFFNSEADAAAAIKSLVDSANKA